jgi:hypothetical protein
LTGPEKKGTPGAPPSFFSVLAVAAQGPLPALGFFAEKVEHYPEGKRDASSHLQRMIRAQEASGCHRVGDITNIRLSQVSFVRADCEQEKVHEVILVATHSAWALVFIFQASDTAAADKLIAGTQFRFTD